MHSNGGSYIALPSTTFISNGVPFLRRWRKPPIFSSTSSLKRLVRVGISFYSKSILRMTRRVYGTTEVDKVTPLFRFRSSRSVFAVSAKKLGSSPLILHTHNSRRQGPCHCYSSGHFIELHSLPSFPSHFQKGNRYLHYGRCG